VEKELIAGLFLQVVKIYYYRQYSTNYFTSNNNSVTLINVFAVNQNNNNYSNSTIDARAHCRVNDLGSNNPWLKTYYVSRGFRTINQYIHNHNVENHLVEDPYGKNTNEL
jgi:hypothetical protein